MTLLCITGTGAPAQRIGIVDDDLQGRGFNRGARIGTGYVSRDRGAAGTRLEKHQQPYPAEKLPDKRIYGFHGLDQRMTRIIRHGR